MKFTERIFKDCGGRCCICGNVYICANGRENTFEVANKEELIRRVDNDEFPFHDAFIVGYLFGKHGYKYRENQNTETGETIYEEEHWCGNLSKDYKFFKEIPNK